MAENKNFNDFGVIIDPLQVDEKPQWDFGTRLQKSILVWRYAQAGEDLKKGQAVVGKSEWKKGEIIAQIYGAVRPAKKRDSRLLHLGWPEVNIPKGCSFWLREKL